MKDTVEVKREWLSMLVEISKDINRKRGITEASPRYSIEFLHGYILAAQSFLDHSIIPNKDTV